MNKPTSAEPTPEGLKREILSFARYTPMEAFVRTEQEVDYILTVAEDLDPDGLGALAQKDDTEMRSAGQILAHVDGAFMCFSLNLKHLAGDHAGGPEPADPEEVGITRVANDKTILVAMWKHLPLLGGTDFLNPMSGFLREADRRAGDPLALPTGLPAGGPHA